MTITLTLSSEQEKTVLDVARRIGIDPSEILERALDAALVQAVKSLPGSSNDGAAAQSGTIERIVGPFAGQIVVHDNFDDPLPEFLDDGDEGEVSGTTADGGG